MDLITGMRVFISIADNGSLAKAGRELDLSPSVVSKNISALEDRLGARLLNRTTRSVSLTEVGFTYLDRARRIVGDVDEAEAAVSSATNAPRGHLRITAPATFSYRHVAPHLPLFSEPCKPPTGTDLSIPPQTLTAKTSFMPKSTKA